MPHSHLPEPFNILIVNPSVDSTSTQSDVASKFIEYVNTRYSNAYKAVEMSPTQLEQAPELTSDWKHDNSRRISRHIMIVSDYTNPSQFGEIAEIRGSLSFKSFDPYNIMLNAPNADSQDSRIFERFAKAKLLQPNVSDEVLNELFDSVIKRALKDEFERPLKTDLFAETVGLIETPMIRPSAGSLPRPRFELELFVYRISVCWEYMEQETKDTLKKYLNIQEGEKGEDMKIGYPTREHRAALRNEKSGQRQKPDAEKVEAQQELA